MTYPAWLIDRVSRFLATEASQSSAEDPRALRQAQAETVVVEMMRLGLAAEQVEPEASVAATLLLHWSLLDRARLYAQGLCEAPLSRRISALTWGIWQEDSGVQVAQDWVHEQADALAQVDADRQALMDGTLSIKGQREAMQRAYEAMQVLSHKMLAVWEISRAEGSAA